MTDLSVLAPGDPLSQPYWEAAARHEFVLQRCSTCGTWQFYARPFCLGCNGEALAWALAAGTGTVYSATTVHIQVGPELTPPYVVAVVELDEGPRILANVVNGPCAIGDRVVVAWREREDGSVLPVFEPAGGGSRGQA